MTKKYYIHPHFHPWDKLEIDIMYGWKYTLPSFEESQGVLLVYTNKKKFKKKYPKIEPIIMEAQCETKQP